MPAVEIEPAGIHGGGTWPMPTLPRASTRIFSVPFVENANVLVPGLNMPVFVAPVNAYEGALAGAVPGLAANGQLKVADAFAGSHCEPFHISTWFELGAAEVT